MLSGHSSVASPPRLTIFVHFLKLHNAQTQIFRILFLKLTWTLVTWSLLDITPAGPADLQFCWEKDLHLCSPKASDF